MTLLNNLSQPWSFADMASQGRESRVIIMGSTGAGKSEFANCASGSSDFLVGRSLSSCTTEVCTSKPFPVDGKIVTVIDTPGFDDTRRGDAGVLSSIAAYLSKSYEQGIKLTGVIFLCRITDIRMAGTAQRTFRIFRELCGESTFGHVLIVTNMWEKEKLEVGERREQELSTKYFKPVLDRGARMVRHDGTRASALNILRHLLDNDATALTIQQEIVDEHKQLANTAAGKELTSALREQAQNHDEELRILRAELEAAMKARDEETRREVQEELEKKREELARIKRDVESMTERFASDKTRLESRIAETEAVNRQHVERLQDMQNLVSQALLQMTKFQAEAVQPKEAEERQARILAEERLANMLANMKHREELQTIQTEMNKRLCALQDEISRMKLGRKGDEQCQADPEATETCASRQTRGRDTDQRERDEERIARLAHLVNMIVGFVITKWTKGPTNPAIPKMC
ncbi:P-loop containing nucleoside triphosphate hydrolase protein [Pisolithus orientalis]|uniref:P-loop containing nucleoside triphosphate hydrolase protein n=1 Tax=Pisolithus orientalis TaxID=936130 RepID=UPI002224D228|nr:P-loop containing nucleoside triphosphate hydrolase protein [Pisolithus orientalis]KAI5989617.1 P-loop containing nucleoside triphosphate hydrolase protein [Pisolithus orientalis]